MDARILIVEDEQEVAAVLTTYLGREGCTVATERDGARGLKRARADPFDAVILEDPSAPVMIQTDGLPFRPSGLNVVTQQEPGGPALRSWLWNPH